MKWKRAVIAFFSAAAVAMSSGCAAILMATLDWETAGVGMIVPVLLVPSTLLFLVCSQVSSLQRWRSWSYWIPVLGLLLWMFAMWSGGGEGSGYAYYTAIALIVSACATFATLYILEARAS
jgi:hypothetical protein